MAPVLLIQVALLLGLVPLAYTTPPDPLWIPGIYDDADHDDAIGVLTDEGQALATLISAGGYRLGAKPQSVNPLAEPPIIAASRSNLHLRSPP